MEPPVQHKTLTEIAAALGGTLVGDPATVVVRPVPAGSDDPEGITFAGDEKYLAKALASGVGAVIARTGSDLQGKAGILVDDPRRAFGAVLAMSARPLSAPPGVHPTAVIDPTAHVAGNCSIGPYVVVGADATVAEGCKLLASSYLGPGCRLGEGTVLMPHAVLVQDVQLGRRCVVHSGAVLGADGFGFVWDGKRQVKVPQVGGVVIGDDVEVGANSCVDRATCGATTLGDGVKLDDLVMVGHNVTVGDHSVMAALVGVAGSCTVGSRVTMGGQVALADHTVVCDDVVLGGRTGVMQDITEPGAYLGTPAEPVRKAMRTYALLTKLSEVFQRVRDLEAAAKGPKA